MPLHFTIYCRVGGVWCIYCVKCSDRHWHLRDSCKFVHPAPVTLPFHELLYNTKQDCFRTAHTYVWSTRKSDSRFGAVPCGAGDLTANPFYRKVLNDSSLPVPMHLVGTTDLVEVTGRVEIHVNNAWTILCSDSLTSDQANELPR